jgi:hypothetical protein
VTAIDDGQPSHVSFRVDVARLIVLPEDHQSEGQDSMRRRYSKVPDSPSFISDAGCNGMLPPSATLCCPWRHSRCTVIRPAGAIQSCHLVRSGLDCQIQWSAAAWRLRSEFASRDYYECYLCGSVVGRVDTTVARYRPMGYVAHPRRIRPPLWSEPFKR